MRILLPPSETKRPGGAGAPLDFARLALPSLNAVREQVVEALVALAIDPAEAQRVLKLSDRQRGEIEQNLSLRTSATMPAADRYTGVLYDALDAISLSSASRRWLSEHVLIHSAPLGLVGALDAIPAYRLAAGTALPGVPPLRRVWAAAVSDALVGTEAPFFLDLRSEAYVALGPLPPSAPGAYVRVVTPTGRALNHFNKKAKGELVRALADARPQIRTRAALLRWAAGRGIRLRETDDDAVIELVVGS